MNEDYADSIAMAAQLGRLDFASALLAVGGLALGVVAVALVLGGVFAWNHFREVAKSRATIEATRIAEELAERKANEYLQDNLHVIVDAYICQCLKEWSMTGPTILPVPRKIRRRTIHDQFC